MKMQNKKRRRKRNGPRLLRRNKEPSQRRKLSQVRISKLRKSK